MPITPYLVYGIITDTNSSIVTSSPVKLHNSTNDEIIETVTNSSGQYLLDLANLTSGYSSGDTIYVYARNSIYVGETTFTQSGEGGRETNITTSYGGITLATIRNTSWKVIYDILQSSSFKISEDSIFSAMNDGIIEDEGYPIVIIFPPVLSKNGVTLKNGLVNCEINFLIEIYHTSSENVKIL